MIIIQHEKHGVLPVHHLSKLQKAEGWTIKEELGGPGEVIEREVEEVEEESGVSLTDMTKAELFEYASEFNVKLDLRMNKANMIKDLDKKLGIVE